MQVPLRSLLFMLLAGAAAFAGPAQPPPPRVPVPLWEIIWEQVVAWCGRTSAPYLPVTPPITIRLAGSPTLQRQPPRLPKVVAVEVKPAALPEAPAPEQPEPSEAEPKPTTAEEEALKFFERDTTKPGNEKQLGPTFDPTFQPAAPLPGSRATYHRE